MSSLPASSSLVYDDPRLVHMRHRRYTLHTLYRALYTLCNFPDDTIAVGEALCDLAAMRVPGSLVVKYGLILKTSVFMDCEENGELARVTRDRLIVRRDLYFAETGRYPLQEITLHRFQNRENIRMGRLNSRRER